MKDALPKIVLAILLFLCLAKLPYSYFQAVRYISTVAFCYWAFQEYRSNKKAEMFIYIVLAVLFQPFLKISLGRELWNAVDVLVGTGLIVSLFLKKRKD
jgi:hypothetical protein